MLVINKNYLSLICGGGRGRYSQLQKVMNVHREFEEQFFMLFKGFTAEEVHAAFPFISENELRIMFKFDAEGHIIAPRLKNNDVISLAQEIVDYDKIRGRR